MHLAVLISWAVTRAGVVISGDLMKAVVPMELVVDWILHVEHQTTESFLSLWPIIVASETEIMLDHPQNLGRRNDYLSLCCCCIQLLSSRS